MAQTKKTSDREKWFDTNVVVEVLIGEVSRNPGDAPIIANLCIGFNSLTKHELEDAIDDLREWKPKIFPKKLSTEKIMDIVEKKYRAYMKTRAG